MKYFEASAKKDIGITAFFETLMTEVYQRKFTSAPARDPSFVLRPGQQPVGGTDGDNSTGGKKKSCC